MRKIIHLTEKELESNGVSDKAKNSVQDENILEYELSINQNVECSARQREQRMIKAFFTEIFF